MLREDRWYYAKMKAPEGHVIKHVPGAVQRFIEIGKWMLNNVIVVETDLGEWKKDRDMTLKVWLACFRDAVLSVRENQDKGHKDYNPWDAGATINTLREKYTEFRKAIMATFREQRRVLMGKG